MPKSRQNQASPFPVIMVDTQISYFCLFKINKVNNSFSMAVDTGFPSSSRVGVENVNTGGEINKILLKNHRIVLQ